MICRGSLRRLQIEQLAVGQLHWSAAKYAPLQEWALVNGIADCYLQVLYIHSSFESCFRLATPLVMASGLLMSIVLHRLYRDQSI